MHWQIIRHLLSTLNASKIDMLRTTAIHIHTVDQLLKIVLNKYINCTRNNNYSWGSVSKRDTEIISLATKMISLKGNLKLTNNVTKKFKKKQNDSNRSGGGNTSCSNCDGGGSVID